MLDGVLASVRRFRTAPVAVVSPTAATTELAAIPAEAGAVGAVAPLPGEPAIASPSASPDQSLQIVVEPHASVPGKHELPPQAHAVSLAELSETIPRKWIVIGGIVVVILIIGAIILAVASSGDYKPSSEVGAGIEGSGPGAPAEKRELELKALLHDLQNGKTCAERKATIAPLVALGDPRAIEPLRAARSRVRAGSAGAGAGTGADNGCLAREVDAAIKALTREPAT